MWFKESDLYFCQIITAGNGEISEQIFADPTPVLQS